jgi:hypothetical protein
MAKRVSVEVHELDNGKVKKVKKYRIYRTEGNWLF